MKWMQNQYKESEQYEKILSQTANLDDILIQIAQNLGLESHQFTNEEIEEARGNLSPMNDRVVMVGFEQVFINLELFRLCLFLQFSKSGVCYSCVLLHGFNNFCGNITFKCCDNHFFHSVFLTPIQKIL